MRSLLPRIIAWGIALSVSMHIVVTILLPGVVPASVVIKGYALAIVAPSAMLLLALGLHAIFPRSITLHPKRIAITHGQSARAIEASRIIRWRFAHIPNDTADVVLRVTFIRKNEEQSKVIIGLGSRLELMHVDRALRRMTKLARLRNE